MGKSEFGKGNSHKDIIARMKAGNRPYLADQIGKCIRHARTEAHEPHDSINLCLKESATYAASEDNRELWNEFEADGAQEGWLHWLHTFQPRQWNDPLHVLVDWRNGIIIRFDGRECGCLEDVEACLYDSDNLRTAKHLQRPAKSTVRSSDMLDDLAAAEKSLKDIPETERQTLIDARRGQGKYRKDLIGVWGRCAVTKCKDEALLRASHIKPWKSSDNTERLDKFNGLLLTPALDHLFDRGLISFNNAGQILFSSRLKSSDALLLGVHKEMELCYVDERHKPYLEEHRRIYGFGTPAK